MKRIIRHIAALLFLFTVFSCEKTSVLDCFKSTGPVTEEERPISGFHTVVLHDNVDLVLESSGTNHLTIEAGENLMKKIITEVNDSVLTISNYNSCNWVRSYETPITAHLRFTQLDTIEYRSIGNITSIDTIHTNNMVIDVKEGAGEIGFTVNATFLHCNLHFGTATIKMKGLCEVCYVYSNSFGLIDNRSLITDFVYLNNRSSNDIYVYAHKTLGVTIENIGNVYYTGNPGNITLDRRGTGNLIKLED
ncbi:MAG: hypothetical protein DRI88_04395 [Bacteroidetes bacterium]|nr:MAG: hypothetical protein DRI72_08405 [Bacteroidota bacterium]RLD48069.1 MAG: hypothetical protein DRI88_04395 [Bacteroidota bacterium]